MLKRSTNIVRRLTILVAILVLWAGCGKSIETCDCSRVDIYGIPIGEGIHLPFSNYEDDIRKMEPLVLTTENLIDSLMSEVTRLEKSDFQHSPFDTHLVVDFHCNDGKKVTVLSSGTLLRYNGSNYEPSDLYLTLMERLIQI